MTTLSFYDRVQETTQTTGTGAIVPGGATPGYRSFASVLSTGDRFHYLLTTPASLGALFEVGIGTWQAGGTIARSPIVSSAGTGAIALPPGTHAIALTAAAAFFETAQAHDVFAAWTAMPGNAGRSVAEFLAAVLGTDGLRIQGQPLVGGRSATTVLAATPPAGVVNSSGGNDGVTTRLLVSTIGLAQGPTAQTGYFDTVASLGLNMGDDVASAENPAMPVSRLAIESKFAQGATTSPFISEYHLASLFPAGEPTNEYRGISVTIPHLSSDWGTSSEASISMRANLIAIYRGASASEPSIQCDLASGNTVSFGSTARAHPTLDFLTNDRVVIRQRNAAGNAQLPLLRLNGNDNIELPGATYIVGATRTTPFATKATLGINTTSGGAGETGIAWQGPAIGAGGDFFAFAGNASVAGRLFHQIYNTGAGASAIEFQTLNGAGNDALLCFSNVGGGKVWTIGYDNSDGDKLKIENSYRSVGDAGATYVEFDANKGATAFTKPAVLPAFAVSALPPAATVGAGAMAYCSNEAGGAVPVFSDGTSWRRVTDRAVVSA